MIALPPVVARTLIGSVLGVGALSVSMLTGCTSGVPEAGSGHESTAVSVDIREARAGFTDTPGMAEFFDDLYRQGIGTTVNEIFALGIYVPGYCETRAQQNLDESQAITEVTSALGETYGVDEGESWAAPIVVAAEEHVCS